MLWIGINQVFHQCICKETREQEGYTTWHTFLMKYDNELKEVNEIVKKYIDNAKSYVDKELTDNLEAV
jgi:hypothetical protein